MARRAIESTNTPVLSTLVGRGEAFCAYERPTPGPATSEHISSSTITVAGMSPYLLVVKNENIGLGVVTFELGCHASEIGDRTEARAGDRASQIDEVGEVRRQRLGEPRDATTRRFQT